MNQTEFILRRKKLLKALPKESIAIIFSTMKCQDTISYKQNSDFYYLTGFVEPESIAVLIPEKSDGTFILFIRENFQKNCEKNIFWSSTPLFYFEANQTYDISMFDEIMSRLIISYKKIYSSFDHSNKLDHRMLSLFTKIKTTTPVISDIHKILSEIRVTKSFNELIAIRKAADITEIGIHKAIVNCKPGKYEFELENKILNEFMRYCGKQNPAFPTIIASGRCACTLHYSKNKKKLKSGELLLIDAGAKYNHYSADVARTFPINGKFSKKQRQLYEIVLTAQKETIKKIRPGISWDMLQSTAEYHITLGLKEEKIISGSIEKLIHEQKFKPFFMHKIGHWIGLDTHDPGEYLINEKWRTLEPGMVLTIEPGLYIRPLNIGIRIEDEILVTKNGIELLTDKVPKEVNSIEKLMKKHTF